MINLALLKPIKNDDKRELRYLVPKGMKAIDYSPEESLVRFEDEATGDKWWNKLSVLFENQGLDHDLKPGEHIEVWHRDLATLGSRMIRSIKYEGMVELIYRKRQYVQLTFGSLSEFVRREYEIGVLVTSEVPRIFPANDANIATLRVRLNPTDSYQLVEKNGTRGYKVCGFDFNILDHRNNFMSNPPIAYGVVVDNPGKLLFLQPGDGMPSDFRKQGEETFTSSCKKPNTIEELADNIISHIHFVKLEKKKIEKYYKSMPF